MWDESRNRRFGMHGHHLWDRIPTGLELCHWCLVEVLVAHVGLGVLIESSRRVNSMARALSLRRLMNMLRINQSWTHGRGGRWHMGLGESGIAWFRK